jgi:[protein-PII] uridylyltransferase
LFNARISTIGSRAEDIFYLTGQNNQPLSDAAEMQELKDTIIGLVGAS